LLLNKEQGKDKVKYFQSRDNYFRSYNQKPHQKEYSKIHQLVGKTKNWEKLSNLSFLIFSVVIIGRELFLVSCLKKKEGIIFVFL
jgi:hypothetical protein